MAQTFPDATQAQLIRANQRDLMSISTLHDRAADVLRPTMGTRWLLRWEKEVDLATRFLYLGLTTGLLNQTLGEEYVDIWQRSARTSRVPTAARRWSLVLLYCIPPYLAARQQRQRQGTHDASDTLTKRVLRMLPSALEVALEVNLALFYFSGSYYSLAKRLLGVKHISSLPRDPNSRPPSYALLGVLLAIRLVHRAVTTLRTISPPRTNSSASSTQAREKQAQDSDEVQLDGRPVAPFLVNPAPDAMDEREEGGDVDEYSALQLRAIPSSTRAARRCVLCLEERSASAATECGHLFCWTCIAGWAREKPECPLCRQAVEANKLWPIANL